MSRLLCISLGNKQETTASWFGMLLEDGSKLPVADTMSFLWNGIWPENRSPLLDHVEIPFANKYGKSQQIILFSSLPMKTQRMIH